jgi:hypothetical protein
MWEAGKPPRWTRNIRSIAIGPIKEADNGHGDEIDWHSGLENKLAEKIHQWMKDFCSRHAPFMVYLEHREASGGGRDRYEIFECQAYS